LANQYLEEIKVSNNRMQGSPFFTATNYRLANYPHSYMFRYGSSQVRPFQCRPWNGVFNTDFNFKDTVYRSDTSYSYLDEVMGLLCILNDAPMFIERRVFFMMLCAIMRIPPQRLADELYTNPVHFPLTQALSWLVFNHNFRNFRVKEFYDSNGDPDI
jgi:hypothetical protein